MNRTLALLAACSLALAGCLGAPAPGTDAQPDTTTATDTPLPTASTTTSPTATAASQTDAPTTPGQSLTSATTDCGEAWLSFWGLTGPNAEDLWNPDQMRVGYTLPANSSVHLVAVGRDGVLGSDHVDTPEMDGDGTPYGIHADGDAVDLDSPLSGTRTVRILMVDDSNHDGEFDPDADAACTSDGDLVATGWKTIDFDRFEAGEPASESESADGS